MKSGTLITFLAFAVFFAGDLSTEAADLRLPRPLPPAPPPVVPAIPQWAGPYVGFHAGYIGGGGDVTLPGASEFHLIDPRGFAGGLVGGYQMQSGSLVYGIEADAGFVNAKKTIATGFDPNPSDTQMHTQIDWNGHLRGRLGFAYGNWLFFGAGGLAFAHIENTATDNVNGVTAKWSSNRPGWSLGGGVETKSLWASTIRLEYIYDNYGRDTLAAQTIGAVTFPEREHKFDSHTLRAGLTWKF